MDYQIGQRRLQHRVGAWMKRPFAHKLRSIAARGQRALDRAEDAAFDKWHRLDCGGYIRNNDLETDYSSALPHARAYQAVSCALMRELFAEARKTGIDFDNFIDLGSGKGKACFYAAARYPFKKIVGVEFSAPLVAVAQANSKRFDKQDISFLNIDAALCSLPEGNNLVFLFNPFGESILRKFLERNIEHFRAHRSLVAYANDQHRLCLASLGFVTIYRNQDTQCSLLQYRQEAGQGGG